MKKQDNNLIKSKKILFLIIIILLLVVFIIVNKNIEKEKVKIKEKEIKANDIMLKPISEIKGKNENVTNIVPETKNKENNNAKDGDNDNNNNIETIETEEEFKEKIIDKKEKAIVYYYAKWCGPCKTMKHIIQELASENINIYKVDVENKNMAKNIYSAGIRAIPTYIYYNNGIEVSREYGIVSKNTLKEKYDKLNN